MAVYTESFNTADSSTLGPDLTWVESFGNLAVASNALTETPAGGGGGRARAEHDVGSDDMFTEIIVTSFVIPSGAVTGAVVARHQSGADSGYLFTVGVDSAAAWSWDLSVFTAGSLTFIAGGDPGTQTTPFTIRIVAIGTQISGYINSTLITSQADSTFTTGQRGGAGAARDTGGTCLLDSFRTGTSAEIIPPVVLWPNLSRRG